MPSDKLPDSTEPERDLHQRVKFCLHQCGYVLHRVLEISIERDVVVVEGRVPTFYLRQIAVESIKRVAGVIQVIDLIQVVDRPQQAQADVHYEDEQVSSVSPMRHVVDLPDTAQTGHEGPHTHVPNRHLLSSAKG